MKRKFVGLITARGGSKGLPRKNILPINGVPLIGWTINAARQCKLISEVYVSTDDEEIAVISEAYGAKIINRPYELATDKASSVDVVIHAIDWLKEREIAYENMVLLQPTSPLRTSSHLSDALNLYIEQKAKLVISVFEPAHTPIKSYIEQNDGSIRGLFSDEAPYNRRQDLPKAFLPNGAIYAFSITDFEKKRHFPISRVFPYVMSEGDSTDIDTFEDLKLVEKKLKELSK
ncbi:acylneuraminate cytidylyltransferase family protein [Vibrio parahaemolyticus]